MCLSALQVSFRQQPAGQALPLPPHWYAVRAATNAAAHVAGARPASHAMGGVNNMAEIRRAQRRTMGKPQYVPKRALTKIKVRSAKPAEVLNAEEKADPEAGVELNTWSSQKAHDEVQEHVLDLGVEVPGTGTEPPRMSGLHDELGGVFDLQSRARSKQAHKPAMFIRVKGKAATSRSSARGNLWYAALHGDLQTVEYLVEVRCIPLDVRNEWGQTALHCSCRNGHADVVFCLLKNGARPWLREQELSTPLHLAAAQGHTVCVELLLQYGASAHPLNGLGLTPLQEADDAGSVAGPRGNGAREAARMIRHVLASHPFGGYRTPAFENGMVTPSQRSYNWDGHHHAVGTHYNLVATTTFTPATIEEEDGSNLVVPDVPWADTEYWDFPDAEDGFGGLGGVSVRARAIMRSISAPPAKYTAPSLPSRRPLTPCCPKRIRAAMVRTR